MLKTYFLHKVNNYFRDKDIVDCKINIKLYKKAFKIRNIFTVDRFADIYRKYNFIGFLIKLNCMENKEMWVNGFEDFVQGTLGVKYRCPLTEIIENDREIYLKGKFIILRNGDSYNLYDLNGIFVSKICHRVKDLFPQIFYTRTNETDVINILLYKNDEIEFKTILIVDDKVKEKRTEYLDRKEVCEKLFLLKDNEFLKGTERTTFGLTYQQTKLPDKNTTESGELCFIKKIRGDYKMDSTFHCYDGKYYAAYVKDEEVFHINELEEVKRNPWDCDPWMFFENSALEHRVQYCSELNKKFKITETMQIEDFCESNVDVECVLWHKNTFFTIYGDAAVVKNSVEFGFGRTKMYI